MSSEEYMSELRTTDEPSKAIDSLFADFEKGARRILKSNGFDDHDQDNCLIAWLKWRTNSLPRSMIFERNNVNRRR